MWVSYNANPEKRRAGDCAIRALSTALNQPWDKTFADLCIDGLVKHDLPNADHIWGEYLRRKGFRRNIMPCGVRLEVTVREFCEDHPRGTYIVCPREHVIAVKDGEYYDTWDSGDEVVIYYWEVE